VETANACESSYNQGIIIGNVSNLEGAQIGQEVIEKMMKGIHMSRASRGGGINMDDMCTSEGGAHGKIGTYG
jgi:hypothetical protein